MWSNNATAGANDRDDREKYEFLSQHRDPAGGQPSGRSRAAGSTALRHINYQEVRAAERVMREAQRAPGIAERPSDQQDQDLNRRLAAEAKKAADAYVKTALALDSQFLATTVAPGVQQLRGATKLYSSFTDT